MQLKLHTDIIHIEFYDKEDVEKYLCELKELLLNDIWELADGSDQLSRCDIEKRIKLRFG